MSTTEQLQLRAMRVLHDGKPHQPQARIWARETLGLELPEAVFRDGPQPPNFTRRELSLGATNFDAGAQ